MNLWGEKIKTGLAILSALFLFHCEEPSELGLDLRDDTDEVGPYYKEIELPSYLISRDSVLTSSSARLLSGIYEHPDLGKINASCYTQFGYGSESVNIADSALLDSLILYLQSDYNFGPDVVNPQKFTLHELEEDLNDTAAYFSFSEVEYSTESLSSRSFLLKPLADTLLSFPLSEDYANRLFNALKDTTLIDPDDVESLEVLFKGFAIIPGSETGIMLRFNQESDESMLSLFYHYPDDTASRRYDFRFFNAANFNRMIADYRGTPLDGIEDQPFQDFQPADNKTYLQSGSGLIPKISFAPVREFFDTIQHAALNQVSLEIKINEMRENEYPPSSLAFYFANENNKRIRSGSLFLGINVDGSTDLLLARYNPDGHRYAVPVTSYTEDLLFDLTAYPEILIYPPEFGLTQTINYFQADPGNIRVKIYYTKLK